MDDEVTAYHECGHAIIAIISGARVKQLTLEPEWDDGPARYGDARVEWRVSNYSARELRLRKAQTALAGPVAEMVYTGDPFHPAFVAEWQSDWDIASSELQPLQPDPQRLMRMLEQVTRELHQLMSNEPVWPAIAALADELLAHETLDEAQIRAAADFWLS